MLPVDPRIMQLIKLSYQLDSESSGGNKWTSNGVAG